MDKGTDKKRFPLRWLTEGELNTFREDYRELEKEIQSFFRAYYISGLILVAAWLTGPQSKPLLELALGNGGYNIYAPIGIAFLNMVATISLIYKSIEIHEVTQFAVYFSESDSAANYWESWRRSSNNYARFARLVYSPLLILVPIGLSCLILIPTGVILYSQPQELINRIKDYQVPPTSIDSLLSAQSSDPTRVIIAENKLKEERREYAERIVQVLPWARFWFKVTVGLHLIPIGLALFNAFVVPLGWKNIVKPRDHNILSEAKTETPSENKEEISQPKGTHEAPAKTPEGKLKAQSDRDKKAGKSK